MGFTYCSSANNNRGQTDTMNLLILLTALAGVALAEPWGYYGYPYYHHQLTWPSVSGPGFSSTIWGARGKRSAEPEAEPEAEPAYGYPGYGYYGYPAVYNVPSLQWPGVRGPGFSQTTFGLRGKRSAEPEPFHPFYGYYGYPYYVRPVVGPVAAPEGTGVAAHPGLATSFVSRSAQGAKAKRSAEPYYGYYGHPYGYGFPYYHQQAWPSYSAPGVSSTVWGLRG